MKRQLTVGAYWGLPDDVRGRADDWLKRMAAPLQALGIARGNKDMPALFLIEWDGERYRVRGHDNPLRPDGGRVASRWVIPPEPPPAELLRYAEPVDNNAVD